jgi:hypothetical protein
MYSNYYKTFSEKIVVITRASWPVGLQTMRLCCHAGYAMGEYEKSVPSLGHNDIEMPHWGLAFVWKYGS